VRPGEGAEAAPEERLQDGHRRQYRYAGAR
jgi:hypothetical protein